MDKEIFVAYFNGSISEEEEKSLLLWIEEIEKNRVEFFQERRLWDLVLLNSSEETLSNNIDQENQKTAKNTRTRWVIELCKIAAIFLVAFFVGSLLLNSPAHSKQKWNTIEVPIGQRTCLRLTDGTTVWLNAKTKFSFPDHFDKNIREVKLDGEAIFDVVHNEKSPFVVKTQQYNVTDLGTRFNVYAYNDNDIFEATLVQGKIMLEKNASKEKAVELVPNQMATYNVTNNSLEIKNVDAAQSICWKDGFYSFNDQPLSSIIQRLERYYEVSIEVKNSKILERKFTGKFRYSDPIEVILSVVKANTPFKFTKKGNIIKIYN